MEPNYLAWSGQSWRLPLWLWLSVAAMAAGTLHILLDASVGLFPAQGSLAPAVAAALLLISLIHAWWAISLAAGARGVSVCGDFLAATALALALQSAGAGVGVGAFAFFPAGGNTATARVICVAQ